MLASDHKNTCHIICGFNECIMEFRKIRLKYRLHRGLLDSKIKFRC